jgi:hypothetical protein
MKDVVIDNVNTESKCDHESKEKIFCGECGKLLEELTLEEQNTKSLYSKKVIQSFLEKKQKILGTKILFSFITGSTAWNLSDKASSDEDFKAVYLEPTKTLFKIHPPERLKYAVQNDGKPDIKFYFSFLFILIHFFFFFIFYFF